MAVVLGTAYEAGLRLKTSKRYLPDRPRYDGVHRRLREQGAAYLTERR